MTDDQLIAEYDRAIRERVKWTERESRLGAELRRRLDKAELTQEE